MKQFSFLSGLPRSGSTLMSAILNQHPEVYASATSGLLELIDAQASAIVIKRKYYHISPEQEMSMLRGMFDLFYSDIQKDFVIDKHRMWPKIIMPLSKLGIEAKIICSNRPIAEIIASYLFLIDKSKDPNNNIDGILRNKNLPINLHNRAMVIWSDYIQIPHQILVNALKQHGQNIHLFNYQELVEKPKEVIANVERFLKLRNFDGYDFQNIKNTEIDKDEAWNLKGLHEIRPNISRVSPPAEQVLGKTLTEYFSQFDIKT
jgi:sulfotransferase